MPWLSKYNGILLIDKPVGITSHDVVQKVRYILQQKEVGHTGTLDPLASGLLVLCLGKATKIAQFISNLDKSYLAEVRLGLRSSTYDAEGIDAHATASEVPVLSAPAIGELLQGFAGKQLQKVPAHAAVRINGQHMYELARQGHHMDLPEREIDISSIALVEYQPPVIRFSVLCSKGTYIRTLAHEIGEKVGCGGYLAGLRRTSVGPFTVEHALTFEQLLQAEEAGSVEEHVVGLERVLQFGSIRINESFERAVIHGRVPGWQDIEAVEGTFEAGDRVMIKSLTGAVLAVAIAGGSSSEFAGRTGQPVASYVRVLA